MKRRRHLAVIVVLFAGCAAPAGVTPPPTVIEAVAPPYLPPPAPTSTSSTVLQRASRSTVAPGTRGGVSSSAAARPPASPTFRGAVLTSTAYCETGRMANGENTYVGAAAGNWWPLGTRLRVSDSPLGPAIYTITDRIGHGSELDFALPGLCRAARHWGRRAVTVEVVP